MTESTLKRTALYECHAQLGGRFVPFAGWEMPVQYAGVVAEHNAVRESAGIFDVSHMGELFVTGPEAEKALNYLTCNDVTALVDGKAQYTAIVNERGGIVDDLIVYRLDPERFLVCANASNVDRDFEWLSTHNTFNAQIENRSADFAQIAVQGPAAISIVAPLFKDQDVHAIEYFHFMEARIFDAPVFIARTGYTGEDGVEIFIDISAAPGAAADLWELLLETGKASGLAPCGLGARDTLRLEACLPLHGHELGDDISAIESGLGWIVKLNKGEFIGRDILAEQKQDGAPRKLAGLFVEDRGIIRHGDRVFNTAGADVGVVTSGTKTPTVDRALGIALVQADVAAVGGELLVEVRGRQLRCSVVKLPFYRRNSS